MESSGGPITIEELVLLVQKELPGAEVFAQDLTGQGNHFEAVIVCDAFAGLSRLQRQRAAMNPFSALLTGRMHALTLKTYTHEEWSQV